MPKAVEIVTKTKRIVIKQHRFLESLCDIKASKLLRSGFQAYKNNPNTLLIIGNNFSSPHTDGNSLVLDGAAIAAIKDEDGVIIGYAQATADGLGHGNENFNKKIAKASNLSTVEFVTHAAGYVKETGEFDHKAMYNALINSGIKSHNIIYPSKKFNRNLAQSAMVTSVITSHRGNVELIHGNVGDCSALIIDPITLEVVDSVTARQFERYTSSEIKMSKDSGVKSLGQGEFFPDSTQSLAFLNEKHPQIVTHDAKSKPIKPGMLIVHFSDGIHDYLPTTITKVDILIDPKTKDSRKSRIVRINHEAVTDLLRKRLNYDETNKKPYTDLEISRAVNAHVYKTILEERRSIQSKRPTYKKVVDLMKWMKKINLKINYKTYSLQDWINELEGGTKVFLEKHKKHSADLPNIKFDEVLKVVQKELQILHATSSDLGKSAISFGNYIYKKSTQNRSGDDATITVVKIPNEHVELLRAALEIPENHSKLIPRLRRLSSDQLKKAFAELRQEIIINNHNDNYNYDSKPQLRYQVPARQLDTLQQQVINALKSSDEKGAYDTLQVVKSLAQFHISNAIKETDFLSYEAILKFESNLEQYLKIMRISTPTAFNAIISYAKYRSKNMNLYYGPFGCFSLNPLAVSRTKRLERAKEETLSIVPKFNDEINTLHEEDAKRTQYTSWVQVRRYLT